MNESLTAVRPEVVDFVAAVRARLADLSEDEREELVGGLEADLTELVDDRGVDALGDPAAYAEELRAAAGLTEGPRRSTRRPQLPTRERVEHRLDWSALRWADLMSRHQALSAGWDLVRVLRPAWWVLRAWVAVQLLDRQSGPWEAPTPVPSLGVDLFGAVLLVVGIVVSVQIGRGRFWPGNTRSVVSRVALLALNAFAVVMLPYASQFPPSDVYAAEDYGYTPPGLANDGRLVTNVFAYDAEGKPLTGVQLFDERGRPLAVNPDSRFYRTSAGDVATYPWFNGSQAIWNGFPLPVRSQVSWAAIPRDVWSSKRPPSLPTPPLAVVPPMSLPTPMPATIPEVEASPAP